MHPTIVHDFFSTKRLFKSSRLKQIFSGLCHTVNEKWYVSNIDSLVFFLRTLLRKNIKEKFFQWDFYLSTEVVHVKIICLFSVF